MKNDPVCWAEGLFLKPHHFQQADAYNQELLYSQNRLDHAHNYGIHEIEINDELLKTGQLEITKLVGRMRDGTYFNFSGRLDLTTAGDRDENRNAQTLIVYLAVPELKERSSNVSETESTVRFQGGQKEVYDLSSGANPQLVDYQKLNLRLMVETQLLSGLDHIPICRLKFSTDGGGARVVDELFVPPVLRTNGCRELARMIQILNDLTNSHLELWTEDIRNKAISFSNYRPEYLRPLFFVTLLGELKAWLHCQTNSEGSHPFEFFQTFTQWLGKLAVLNPVNGDYAPAFPKYDHENLTDIFSWLTLEFRRRLFLPEDSNVIPVLFKGHKGIMTASVKPEWLTSSKWKLYFGINVQPIPDSDREFFVKRIFFDPAHKLLYWKMGSQERTVKYFTAVSKGVTVHKHAKHKPGLPSRPIWLFGEFVKDEYWEEVKRSYTLSFRVDEDKIHNIRELEGNDEITVKVEGKIYTFQLCVFAVRE